MPKINKGKIVTVTSMKGGVGKTVTVLCLAAVYADLGKKVLIVDLDLYNGDIAFALNINFRGTIFNLTDDMANNRFKYENTNSYVYKYNDNIDILPSPKDPRQASKVDQKYIEMILENNAHKYDVVLVDTSHILGPINMVAFDCSDTIVNLLTNDSFDLKSTKTFISICENVEINNLVLVLNNSVDYRKNYYSHYDMKSIINQKIDYIIPASFYMEQFDGYIVDNRVLEYCLKTMKSHKKDYQVFTKLAIKLLQDNTAGEVDHEKE